jgi:hypothetical protein
MWRSALICMMNEGEWAVYGKYFVDYLCIDISPIKIIKFLRDKGAEEYRCKVYNLLLFPDICTFVALNFCPLDLKFP